MAKLLTFIFGDDWGRSKLSMRDGWIANLLLVKVLGCARLCRAKQERGR